MGHSENRENKQLDLFAWAAGNTFRLTSLEWLVRNARPHAMADMPL